MVMVMVESRAARDDTLGTNTRLAAAHRWPSSRARARRQAFISHSWRDCPREKHRLLQEWRARFVASRGREPTVWLDFCCLRDDAAGVVCLPVYLSGCQTLLAMRGPTFLKRLW
jgi:hypothetical protein